MAPVLDVSPSARIQTLGPLEHLRLRTGMYIGRLGDGSNPMDGIGTKPVDALSCELVVVPNRGIVSTRKLNSVYASALPI